MDIKGETIQNGEPTTEYPCEIENKINLTGAIQILNKLKSKVTLVKVDDENNSEKEYRLPFLMNIEQQAIETVLSELKKKENMYIKEYNEHMEKKRQSGVLINNEQILKRELEKKEKRISDLEFALMDMVLQFADESKDKISTMGLSALEIAFSELDFNNPMPIKEVHKRYKKLAQEYYKVEREGK